MFVREGLLRGVHTEQIECARNGDVPYVIKGIARVIYEKACQEKILSLLTKKPKKCFLAMRPFR
ncbi:MAG: hypothetical protein DYG84_12140, partial [Candidatus Brocadia sp. AMX3]|nr:hypothetical protein [Candidatus Brocadia sp. AMX3]